MKNKLKHIHKMGEKLLIDNLSYEESFWIMTYKPFYFQINENKKSDGTIEIDFKGQFNSSDVHFVLKDLPEEDRPSVDLLSKRLPSRRLLEAYMLARWSELKELQKDSKKERRK